MGSDIRCLQAAQLDFTAMVRRRLHQLASNRLSASRVEGLRADNPERALMLDQITASGQGVQTVKLQCSANGTEILGLQTGSFQATSNLAKGMKVHLPVDFEPNGMRERPTLRKTYVAVATAVNKMLGAVVEQRLAFLLPLDMAQRYMRFVQGTLDGEEREAFRSTARGFEQGRRHPNQHRRDCGCRLGLLREDHASDHKGYRRDDPRFSDGCSGQ